MHRRPMRARPALAAGSVLTAAAVLAAAISAQAAPPGLDLAPTNIVAQDEPNPLDDVLDVRDVLAAIAPTLAQQNAVSALLTSAGSGTRVTWDERFGTPRSLRREGGYLTGPSAGTPVAVARAYLAGAAAAFRLSPAQVADLAVARDHALPGTGTHVVTFTQTFDGRSVVRGGRLTVAVSSDGRVLSYDGDPVGGGALQGGYSLSPAQALLKVAGVLAPAADLVADKTGTQAGYDVFARGPLAASSYVKAVAFPTRGGARAAYRVQFVKALDQAWDVVVDAGTGEVLYRASLVDHESNGSVYENYPGAPQGGTQATKSFGPTAQSPKGYVDPTGVVGGGVTTLGNNASTYANYSNFLVPADQGPRPVSPTGTFAYAYQNRWAATKGATAPPSYVDDLNPAATNLFYQHNRIHDEFYELGFTESAGNFQLDNGGGGGQSGNPIIGLVHAGAASGGAPTYTGRDNAYMLTLDDGIAPWSGMFLWEPIDDAFEGPYSDGNFDTGVIEHEYAHGLSNRYVAGGSALGSQRGRSMGEGWSDWYALNHLYSKGLATTAVVGQFVTGNDKRGIRNWDYDGNPTTFGDIGYDVTGPEVHSDGEIWTATLWDLRKALVAVHGAAKGGEIAARLVTDGMPLTAPDPSFLDARDGILVADVDRFHGDNTDLIWSVFAKRGGGASAVSATGDNTEPTPGFDHPATSRNGLLSLQVVNASTGAGVVNAKVILGRFEARVSPSARTSSTGGASVTTVAGTYPVTISAPGFGTQTFEGQAVAAGRTASTTIKLAPNLASLASGATVVSTSSQDPAQPGSFALDDTAATVWRTANAPAAYNAGLDQRLTIKLARRATVDRLKVSAYPAVGGGRFATLKDFTVQVSDDNVVWRTVRTGSFGYQTPRPMAPDLNYATFALERPTKAAYVRFFVDSVQGNTSKAAQVAEVEVFGSAGALTPSAPPTDPPFTDSGTITAGNPAAGDPTGLANVYGVTGTDFTTTCRLPVASQGADALVSALPPGFGDGQHTVTATGAETPAGHDLDLYFLGSDCKLKGSAATAAANESGVIPGGTAYVLTHLYTGAQLPVTITATDAG